jgi:hypothetical protein
MVLGAKSPRLMARLVSVFLLRLTKQKARARMTGGVEPHSFLGQKPTPCDN